MDRLDGLRQLSQNRVNITALPKKKKKKKEEEEKKNTNTIAITPLYTTRKPQNKK